MVHTYDSEVDSVGQSRSGAELNAAGVGGGIIGGDRLDDEGGAVRVVGGTGAEGARVLPVGGHATARVITIKKQN